MTCLTASSPPLALSRAMVMWGENARPSLGYPSGSAPASSLRAISTKGSAPAIPTHRTFGRRRFGNAPVPSRRTRNGFRTATLDRIASAILGTRGSSVSPRNFNVRWTWLRSTSFRGEPVGRSSSTRTVRAPTSGRSTEMNARNATRSRPLRLVERPRLRINPAARVPLADAKGHQLLRLLLRAPELARHRGGVDLAIAFEERPHLGEPAIPAVRGPPQPSEGEGGDQADPRAEARRGREGSARPSRGDGEDANHSQCRYREETEEAEEKIQGLRGHRPSSPRHRRAMERLSQDRAPEGIEVPPVDDEERDLRLGDHARGDGIKHDRRGRSRVALTHEVDQLLVREALKSPREGILLRVLSVHSVHGRRVHKALRVENPGEARGDAVCRPSRRRPSHHDDGVPTGQSRRLRVRFRGLRIRELAQCDREKAGVHPRDLDSEFIEASLASAKAASRLDVVARDSPAAGHGEDFPTRGEVGEKRRKSGQVRPIPVPRHEDGPAKGDDNAFQGDDRVRIRTLRKYLASLRGHLRGPPSRSRSVIDAMRLR